MGLHIAVPLAWDVPRGTGGSFGPVQCTLSFGRTSTRRNDCVKGSARFLSRAAMGSDKQS